ncbi:MAG TPA: M23 family metallopeptidase [Vicinamibacterales bacterium]
MSPPSLLTSTAAAKPRFRDGFPPLLRRSAVAVMVAGIAASSGAAGAGVTVAVAARAIEPGELMLVTVTAPVEPTRVSLSAFGRRVDAYRTSDRRYEALVGVDLDQAAGDYRVSAEVQTEGDALAASRTITVRPKTFRTRTLHVDPSFVNPPPDVLERIERENALLQQAYAGSAAARLWSSPFLRPVPQAANSAFGTRSVFNGEPRSPHAGTDFLSPAGTPVKAPNAGRVVIARDLFFSGNTVVIDHGLGLFSLLAHLSRIDVHEGDPVERGALVGLVGATGRVTGPHLHWAVRAGDARVSALSLLALVGGPPAAP